MTAKTRFYSGQNGPVACRNRAMSDRVADFLSIFQEGAAKCGLEATIDVAKFSASDIPAILAKLRPGQSVRNETATSKAAVNIIGFAKPTMDFTFPVACLPRMAYIAEQIQNAQRPPTAAAREAHRRSPQEGGDHGGPPPRLPASLPSPQSLRTASCGIIAPMKRFMIFLVALGAGSSLALTPECFLQLLLQ